MNLLEDESLKTRHEVDIETERLATQRLADVVDRRLSRKHISTYFDVREGDLELDLEPHEARKGHIFNDHIQALTDHGLSDAYSRTTLGLTLFLTWRDVMSAVSLGVKLNLQSIITTSSSALGYVSRAPSRRLVAHGEGLELQAVQEGGSGGAEEPDRPS